MDQTYNTLTHTSSYILGFTTTSLFVPSNENDSVWTISRILPSRANFLYILFFIYCQKRIAKLMRSKHCKFHSTSVWSVFLLVSYSVNGSVFCHKDFSTSATASYRGESTIKSPRLGENLIAVHIFHSTSKDDIDYIKTILSGCMCISGSMWCVCTSGCICMSGKLLCNLQCCQSSGLWACSFQFSTSKGLLMCAICTLVL